MTSAEQWSNDRNYKLPVELVQEFYDKVIKLAEKTFGRDCDNCLPVEISVVDRTRFEGNHYLDVIYNKSTTDAPIESDERFDTLISNLEISLGRVRTEMKLRRHDKLMNQLKEEFSILQNKVFEAVDRGETMDGIKSLFKKELERLQSDKFHILLFRVSNRIEKRDSLLRTANVHDI